MTDDENVTLESSSEESLEYVYHDTNDSYFRYHEPPIANFVRFLVFYGTPLIAAVGIVGNLTCLICIRLMTDRSHRSCILYTVGLFIAYTLHLSTLLDKWIADIGYGIYGSVGGWCQFVTFLSQSCEFLTQWYAAGLAFDRCANAAFRHCLAPLVCTVLWARTALVIFGALAIVVYINISITSGEVIIEGVNNAGPICHTLSRFRNVVLQLKVAHVFINNLLPLGIVQTSVLLIVLSTLRRRPRDKFHAAASTNGDAAQQTTFLCDHHKRSKVHSERGVVTSRSVDELTGCSDVINGTGQRAETVRKNVTPGYSMALLATFLACHLPAHLYASFDAVWNLLDGGDLTRYLTLCALSVLKHLCEAAPFFCMFFTSESFRTALVSICRPLLPRSSTTKPQACPSMSSSRADPNSIELADA